MSTRRAGHGSQILSPSPHWKLSFGERVIRVHDISWEQDTCGTGAWVFDDEVFTLLEKQAVYNEQLTTGIGVRSDPA